MPYAWARSRPLILLLSLLLLLLAAVRWPAYKCAPLKLVAGACPQVLQLLGQADMKPAQQLVAEDKASKAAGAAGAGTALADAARAKEQQKQGSGSRPSYSIGAVH